MEYKGLNKAMRKVIDGKVYNTETARFLAKHHGKTVDNSHHEESLFIKRTGEYFIFGFGNSHGSNGHSNHNGNTKPVAEIKPLTLSEAKEWAMKNLSNTEYESIFGGVTNGNGYIKQHPQISILVPQPIVEALKKRKEETGINVSALIIKALRETGYGN